MTAPVARRLEALELRTVGDLFKHLPIRYETEAAEEGVSDALVASAAAAPEVTRSLRGEIVKLRMIPGRRPRIEALLGEGQTVVRLVWFNASWMAKKLHPGMRGIARGRAKVRQGYLEMVNPKWETIGGEDEPAPDAGRLRPIYGATEELPSSRIEVLVRSALPRVIGLIVDPLHEALRARRGLPLLAEAYRMVHDPSTLVEAERGRTRLAYDELLSLQLAMAMRRWQVRHLVKAHPIEVTPAIDARIRSRLPFDLTRAQSGACSEIAADLARTMPMNRLLQGDVGSGKTAVCVYAMLAAVAHGHQGVLVAPTEILAQQHLKTVESILHGSKVRVALYTGTLRAADRATVLAGMESGGFDIVVGTHAVLTKEVRFKSLAIAVIDEQHRFGVEQRAAIRAKGTGGAAVPHTLVMTATPIPRTLALSFFGDLDMTSLKGRLPGRTAPTTRVVPSEKARDVYSWVSMKVRNGEQAFVVVPAIETSVRGLADVASHADALGHGPLAGARIGRLHGQLSSQEREQVMESFREGSLDVLVATVMVEVGVDVPNATVMVVEHAEQFGLAQLHQLRGRVGRGGKPGTCIFITEPTTALAQKRLDALATSDDGFAIAELDLSLRGPGEFFGQRQSGLPDLKVADLARDFALLMEARADAEAWVGTTGDLTDPRDALLRRKVLALYADTLGLGDIG